MGPDFASRLRVRAGWIARALGVAALVLGVTGCPLEPSAPAGRPPPPPAALPTVPPAPPPVALAPLGPLRVLYRDDWHGSVQLIGIDAATHRAFLRMESDEPKRLAIDTVDYESGKRLERWEATPVNASATVRRYPVFRPLTGTFEQDLVRYAGILAAAGPWHTRGRSNRPTVAIGAPGGPILYGAQPTDQSDGDWLFLADKDGRMPQRIDRGLKASYAPVFSPDGRRVAWKGCVASPCGYAVFITKVGGAPERVNQLVDPGMPVWSGDGNAVFVVARAGPGAARRGQGPCLFRIPVAATWETKPVRCMPGLSEVEFVQDPGGRTGVLTAASGLPGQQVVEYAWMHMADGAVLATQSVDRASGIGVLSESGLLLLPLQKGGVGFIDMVSGKSAGVRDSDGWFLGLESTKWVGDSVILLRRGSAPPAFDLVVIDARAVAR
jgi:hypothetical protein